MNPCKSPPASTRQHNTGTPQTPQTTQIPQTPQTTHSQPAPQRTPPPLTSRASMPITQQASQTPGSVFRRGSLRAWAPRGYQGDALEKVFRLALTNLVEPFGAQHRKPTPATPAASQNLEDADDNKVTSSTDNLNTTTNSVGGMHAKPDDTQVVRVDDFDRLVTSLRNNLEAELRVAKTNMEEIAAIRKFKAAVASLTERLESDLESESTSNYNNYNYNSRSRVQPNAPFNSTHHHSSKQDTLQMFGVKRGTVMFCVNRLDEARLASRRPPIGSRTGKKPTVRREQIDNKFDPMFLLDEFCEQRLCKVDDAIQIINKARNIMASEDNIVRLRAPVAVVGDIHGQFFDLVKIFDMTGPPSPKNPFLFLGDFVDRGKFSCEVMLLLFAFKAQFPDQVILIRGNHECRSVSGFFGFKEECKLKYGLQVYYQFLLAFQAMPLCAVVKTDFGEIFACHGGLSPALPKISDINKIDRFVEPALEGILCDILWADPDDPITDPFQDGSDSESVDSFVVGSNGAGGGNVQSADGTAWPKNTARGCSFKYGGSSVEKFLQKNGLVSLVRAHEVMKSGFRFHFSTLQTPSLLCDSQQQFPPAITIFSAPNYCGTYGNQGSVLRISSSREHMELITYDAAESPTPRQFANQTKTAMERISETCPYMPTTFGEFVKVAADLGPPDAKQKKPAFLSRRRSSLSTINSLPSDQQFEIAMHNDAINELHPDTISDRVSEAGALSDQDLSDPDISDGENSAKASKASASNLEHGYLISSASTSSPGHGVKSNEKGTQRANEQTGRRRSDALKRQNSPSSSPMSKAKRGSFSDYSQLYKDQLSEDEFRSLRLLFALMDREGNGKISLEAMADASEEIDGHFNMNDVRMAMVAFGADGESSFDFHAYIMFALRLKDIHSRVRKNSTSNAAHDAASLAAAAASASEEVQKSTKTLLDNTVWCPSALGARFFVSSLQDFSQQAQSQAQQRLGDDVIVTPTQLTGDPDVLQRSLVLGLPYVNVFENSPENEDEVVIGAAGLVERYSGWLHKQPVDVWTQGLPAAENEQVDMLVELAVTQHLPPHPHLLRFSGAGERLPGQMNSTTPRPTPVDINTFFSTRIGKLDSELAHLLRNRLPSDVRVVTPSQFQPHQVVSLQALHRRKISDLPSVQPHLVHGQVLLYDGESIEGHKMSLLERHVHTLTLAEDTFAELSLLNSLHHPNVCALAGVSVSCTPLARTTSNRSSSNFTSPHNSWTVPPPIPKLELPATVTSPDRVTTATTTTTNTSASTPPVDPRERLCIATATNVHGVLRELAKHISWPLRVRLCFQIADALCFLHSRSVVHRRVTPDTIVVDHTWQAHLSDFRLARSFDSIESSPNWDELFARDEPYGAWYLRSPEEIRKEFVFSAGLCDMFSLGLVLLELITLRVVDSTFPSRDEDGGWRVDTDELRSLVVPGCPPSLVELTLQLLGDADFRPDCESTKEWLDALLNDLGGSQLPLPSGLLVPRSKLFIITEPSHFGSLRQVTRSVELSWSLRVRLARDIGSGLDHLHSHGLVLRNLNSHNVFINADWRAKLTQLHQIVSTTSKLCQTGSQQTENTNSATQHAVGRKRWLSFFSSPEALRGEDDSCSALSDMFSFGLVILEIITGREVDESFPDRVARFCIEEASVRASISSLCPASLVDLIRKLLSPDPQDRPPAHTAVRCLEALLENLGAVVTPQVTVEDSFAHVPESPRLEAGTGEAAEPKFTYAELRRIVQRDEIEKFGLNAARLESYLTDEEFQAVFHMRLEEFEILPYWKRKRAKAQSKLV